MVLKNSKFLKLFKFTFIIFGSLLLIKFLFLDKINNIFEPNTVVEVKADEFGFELKNENSLYLSLFTYKNSEIEINFQTRTSEDDIDCSKYKFKTDNTGGLIRKFKISEILGQNCINTVNRIYHRGEIIVNNLEEINRLQKNKYFNKVVSKLFFWIFKKSHQNFHLTKNAPLKFKFFFNTEDEFNKKNNYLMILPSSNLFNYFANTTYLNDVYYNDYQINNYTDKLRKSNVPYLHFSRQLPIYKTKKTLMYPDYDKHIFRSIKNFNNLNIKFDIIHDYEINENIFNLYEYIIFPYHQEYVTDEMMEVLKNKLDNQAGYYTKIISIGGANFYRPFNIKKLNGKIDNFEYFFTKYPLWKYGINGHGLSAECVFENKEIPKISRKKAEELDVSVVEKSPDKNMGDYFLGEVAWKFKKDAQTIILPETSEDFFYDFKCKNVINFNDKSYKMWKNFNDKEFSSPLLSIHKYKGGKVIQFNSDGSGLNFFLHENLKNKFLAEIK